MNSLDQTKGRTMIDLYSQTQRRILDNMEEQIEALFNARSDVKRFEALCKTLCERGLQFEPNLGILPDKVAYQISTLPSHAGEIMLALCSMGCMENERRQEEITQPGDCDIYTITGPCSPQFSLVVSPYTVIRQCPTTAARIACCAEVEP